MRLYATVRTPGWTAPGVLEFADVLTGGVGLWAAGRGLDMLAIMGRYAGDGTGYKELEVRKGGVVIATFDGMALRYLRRWAALPVHLDAGQGLRFRVRTLGAMPSYAITLHYQLGE